MNRPWGRVWSWIRAREEVNDIWWLDAELAGGKGTDKTIRKRQGFILGDSYTVTGVDFK